jgi:WS/DGAT/MGAT family acyltransferase
VRGGIKAMRNPSQAVDDLLSAGLMTAASAAVLTRLIVIPSDRETIFRGELGTAKKVVWSEPVDLERVKEIGRATGCTVNDILIAALTGALRTYMETRGDAPDIGDLRAMVPVNLRPTGGPLELGNEFGMVYLSLPVSTGDPLRRLFEVKRRMDMLKRSPEANVVYKVLNLLGRLPGELASVAVDHFAGKASAVLTNVPGPQETLYFDGVPIRRILFWVPQSGNIGLGISIISYDGLVTLGLVIDEKLSTNPEEILDQFHAEFDALADQVSILSERREYQI